MRKSESEVRVRARATRDKEREKITKILNASASVTVHKCTVIVAMWMFLVKMCKMKGFFFFLIFCKILQPLITVVLHLIV